MSKTHAPTRRRGILSHLAATFTTQGENLTTEALGFILRDSKAARQSLADLLSVEVDRVANQVVVGEESRPDLATYDEQGKLTAFIEAKIWAGLTDAQPLEYLQRLRELGGKVLLFLVPSARMESISAEITARLAAKRETLHWTREDDLKTSELSDGVSVKIASWATLFQKMHSKCSEADTATLPDLEQFQSLVEFESEKYCPLSREALTNLEYPRMHMTLTNACRKAVQQAGNKGLIHFDGLKETHFYSGGGRYVGLKFAPSGFWIGMDCDAWMKFQSSPLWMRFKATAYARADVARRALRELKPTILHFVDERGQVFVPVFVKAGAEEAAVIDEIVRQIKVVVELLSTAVYDNYVAPQRKRSTRASEAIEEAEEPLA